MHGVDINAATFSYFNTDQGEFVARATLLDEDLVERRAEARANKRRPIPSEEALRQVAQENGLSATSGISRFVASAKLPESLVRKPPCIFRSAWTKAIGAVLSIFPSMSSDERGLAVTVVFDHLSRGFGIDASHVRQICGTVAETTFDGSYSTADNNYYLMQGEA